MFGRLSSLIGGGGGPAFGFVPYPTAEGDDAVLQRPSDNSMWTVTRGKAKVRVCALLLAYPSRDDAIVFMISAPFVCISSGACIPIACSVLLVLHMLTLRCESCYILLQHVLPTLIFVPRAPSSSIVSAVPPCSCVFALFTPFKSDGTEVTIFSVDSKTADENQVNNRSH